YGACAVHRDVIAEGVRAGQRDAALSTARFKVKTLQRARRLTTSRRSAQRTQVVRAGPERIRCLIREHSQDRPRAQCARLDEYGALACARLDAHNPLITHTPDQQNTS